MSGDKKNTNKIREVQLSGKVVIKKIAEGSKSERNAVLLQTGNKSYILRKIGGNPFHDPSLEILKGKHITVRGMLSRNLFLAKEIREDL
ncbi:MAG TPA: hypothetical protein PLR74_14950 [Agriterribacter sp.]|nr:hypothetical protein [Agriterribacter sp.]